MSLKVKREKKVGSKRRSQVGSQTTQDVSEQPTEREERRLRRSFERDQLLQSTQNRLVLGLQRRLYEYIPVVTPSLGFINQTPFGYGSQSAMHMVDQALVRSTQNVTEAGRGQGGQPEAQQQNENDDIEYTVIRQSRNQEPSYRPWRPDQLSIGREGGPEGGPSGSSSSSSNSGGENNNEGNADIINNEGNNRDRFADFAAINDFVSHYNDQKAAYHMYRRSQFAVAPNPIQPVPNQNINIAVFRQCRLVHKMHIAYFWNNYDFIGPTPLSIIIQAEDLTQTIDGWMQSTIWKYLSLFYILLRVTGIRKIIDFVFDLYHNMCCFATNPFDAQRNFQLYRAKKLAWHQIECYFWGLKFLDGEPFVILFKNPNDASIKYDSEGQSLGQFNTWIFWAAVKLFVMASVPNPEMILCRWFVLSLVLSLNMESTNLRIMVQLFDVIFISVVMQSYIDFGADFTSSSVIRNIIFGLSMFVAMGETCKNIKNDTDQLRNYWVNICLDEQKQYERSARAAIDYQFGYFKRTRVELILSKALKTLGGEQNPDLDKESNTGTELDSSVQLQSTNLPIQQSTNLPIQQSTNLPIDQRKQKKRHAQNSAFKRFNSVLEALLDQIKETKMIADNHGNVSFVDYLNLIEDSIVGIVDELGPTALAFGLDLQ